MKHFSIIVSRISIHSSTQELTSKLEDILSEWIISIHSSTQELTYSDIVNGEIMTISIHSSTQELTSEIAKHHCRKGFQFTAPRRS